MSDYPETYDLAIVGGGLAGLSLAIQIKRMGHTVILFEKEKYPFHRVCGEYISMESTPFLKEMGIDISAMELPMINKLEVSSPDGTLLKHDLSPGGLGISRHLLDFMLAGIARNEGVRIMENDKVQDIEFSNGFFEMKSSISSSAFP